VLNEGIMDLSKAAKYMGHSIDLQNTKYTEVTKRLSNSKILKLVVCILLRVLGQVQGIRLTQHFRMKMVIRSKHVAVTK
jgi:hypothetical protein